MGAYYIICHGPWGLIGGGGGVLIKLFAMDHGGLLEGGGGLKEGGAN